MILLAGTPSTSSSSPFQILDGFCWPERSLLSVLPHQGEGIRAFLLCPFQNFDALLALIQLLLQICNSLDCKICRILSGHSAGIWFEPS